MKRIISVLLALSMICSFCMTMNINAVAEEEIEYKDIIAGIEQTVTNNYSEKTVYFKFVPEESGWYKYYSIGQCDVYGTVCNSKLGVVANDDNYQQVFGQYETVGNFDITYNFEAGKTYYLTCKAYVYGTGSYNVEIKKVGPATAMQLGNSEVHKGEIGGTGSIKINYIPADCEPEIVSWSSSNTDVVEIDGNGLMKYKALGSAVVTATTKNGLSDTIEVVVEDRKELPIDTEARVFLGGGSYEWIKLVPKESGVHTFYMRKGVDNRIMLYISLYDKDLNKLTSLDYEYYEDNGLTYDMTAGESYYIKIYSNGGCIMDLGFVGFIKGETSNIPAPTPTPIPTPTPDVTPSPTPTVEPTGLTGIVSTEIPTVIPTEISQIVLGDINSDSNVNAEDAVLVLKHVAKLEEITTEALEYADVDKNQHISSIDALMILKYAANIITEF